MGLRGVWSLGVKKRGVGNDDYWMLETFGVL